MSQQQSSEPARVPGPNSPSDTPARSAGPLDEPLDQPLAADEVIQLAEDEETSDAVEVPRLKSPAKGRRLVAKDAAPAPPFTPQQRLLLLDTWRRSGLPAGDFADLDRVEEGCCHPSPPSEPYVRL